MEPLRIVGDPGSPPGPASLRENGAGEPTASAPSVFGMALRGHGTMVALVVAAAATSGVATMALIAVINDLVGPSPRTTFLHFVAAAAVALGAGAASQLLVNRLATAALLDLRLSLCRKITMVPLSTLEQIGSSRVLAVLTEDVPAVATAVVQLPFVVIGVATVVAALAYLAYLSPLAFGALAALLGTAILTSFLLQRMAEGLVRRTREQVGILYQRFGSLIGGAKELRLDGNLRRGFLDQGVGNTAREVRRRAVASEGFNIAWNTWTRALLYGAIACVAAITLRTAAPHVAARFVVVVIFLMSPLEAIMMFLPTYGRAVVGAQTISRFDANLGASGAERSASDRPVEPSVVIELQSARYSYRSDGDNRVFTLGPIDFTFRPGEIVFIVGGNGSGKSTLGKILTGLYEPHGGEILLNDRLIDDSNRTWYREHFAAIFLDYFLFDTVWGSQRPDLEAAAAGYLRDLRLDHKVTFEGRSFSTTELSQGQKKRLALVTAFLSERPVYLFDEWASDQDPVFKRFFYERLLPDLKRRGKTVIAISHDDRYFHVADTLMKLEDGRLVNDSTVQFMSRIRGSTRPPAP